MAIPLYAPDSLQQTPVSCRSHISVGREKQNSSALSRCSLTHRILGLMSSTKSETKLFLVIHLQTQEKLRNNCVLHYLIIGLCFSCALKLTFATSTKQPKLQGLTNSLRPTRIPAAHSSGFITVFMSSTLKYLQPEILAFISSHVIYHCVRRFKKGLYRCFAPKAFKVVTYA